MDRLHHIAICVQDIATAVAWYTNQFQCEVTYQDETWAMLHFENIQLALVIPSQHPAHLAFESANAEKNGPLTHHRDGTQSIYIQDPDGNTVEILKKQSLS